MTMEWAVIIVSVINGAFGIAILVQGNNTHRTFNSRMDEFISLIKKTSYAEGERAGKDSK